MSPRLLRAVPTLLALVACWWAFVPLPGGGNLTFALPDGVSMEPKLHKGDLVVVRKDGHARPGEVFAYHSRRLRRVGLHRVRGAHSGRYVFRGDNNSWDGPEHPADSQLVGQRWFVV